jgi:hypothetical protein
MVKSIQLKMGMEGKFMSAIIRSFDTGTPIILIFETLSYEDTKSVLNGLKSPIWKIKKIIDPQLTVAVLLLIVILVSAVG